MGELTDWRERKEKKSNQKLYQYRRSNHCFSVLCKVANWVMSRQQVLSLIHSQAIHAWEAPGYAAALEQACVLFTKMSLSEFASAGSGTKKFIFLSFFSFICGFISSSCPDQKTADWHPRGGCFLLVPVQMTAAVGRCVDGWVGFLSKGRKNSQESLRDMLHPQPPTILEYSIPFHLNALWWIWSLQRLPKMGGASKIQQFLL